MARLTTKQLGLFVDVHGNAQKTEKVNQTSPIFAQTILDVVSSKPCVGVQHKLKDIATLFNDADDTAQTLDAALFHDGLTIMVGQVPEPATVFPYPYVVATVKAIAQWAVSQGMNPALLPNVQMFGTNDVGNNEAKQQMVRCFVPFVVCVSFTLGSAAVRRCANCQAHLPSLDAHGRPDCRGPPHLQGAGTTRSQAPIPGCAPTTRHCSRAHDCAPSPGLGRCCTSASCG
jgi:hypothetical protein